MTTGRRTRRPIVGPAVCTIIGAMLIMTTAAIVLAIAMPPKMGYQPFVADNPISGHQDIIWAQESAPSEARENDSVLVMIDDVPTKARVMANRTSSRQVVIETAGADGSETATTDYEQIIGRIVYEMPDLGEAFSLCQTPFGTTYLAMTAVCGIMFEMLAAQTRRRVRQQPSTHPTTP